MALITVDIHVGVDKFTDSELECLLGFIDCVVTRTYAYDSLRYKLRKLRYG